MRVIFLANLVSILLGAQVGNLGGHIQRDRETESETDRGRHTRHISLELYMEASDEISR